MKVNVSYHELNGVIERVVKQPISISHVNNNTIQLTYVHEGFLKTIDIKLELNVSRQNYISVVAKSDTPGIEKIVSGVLEFTKSRLTNLDYISIDNNMVNVDLAAIPQLSQVLKMVTVCDFTADYNGVVIQLGL